ncbi:DUF11 domain-containing protein [Streptomyces sp. NPDC007369]|uniref:DUF11 domain-containing protein n=1 Tax=Streptomyces sp. NPDC007369 TaxID=3154589 RepID=UPI0033F33CFA
MLRGSIGRTGRRRRLRALSALGVAGLVAGLACGMPASAAGAAQQRLAPVPVDCDGKVYVSFGEVNDQLATVVRGPGEVRFKRLGPPQTTLYNAIGVNPLDRFLYATSFGNGNELLRFDGTGAVTNLGAIAGLPPALYISGTFDSAGTYYVLADDTGEIYQINVGLRAVTGVISVPELADPELDVFDIAFRDGFLWGSTESGAITRIDIDDESVDFFPGVLPSGADYGGVFTYGNGDLGFFRNAGQLFRVRVQAATGPRPRFTVLSEQTAPPARNLDATSCFLDSSADLAVHKEAPKSAKAGQDFTYRITVRNTGNAGDSSGWSLVDDLPLNVLSPTTATKGCEIADGVLSCTGGPLPIGRSATIKVTGTAADVPKDTTVSNTARVFGDDADPRRANDVGTAQTKIKKHGGNDCRCAAEQKKVKKEAPRA